METTVLDTVAMLGGLALFDQAAAAIPLQTAFMGIDAAAATNAANFALTFGTSRSKRRIYCTMPTSMKVSGFFKKGQA